MRLAVTGCTGFVGGHVVRQAREAGHDVRALIRKPEQADRFTGQGIEFIHGDMCNSDALRALVSDADAIIHIAGAIKAWTREDIIAINAGGTANLVSVAREHAPNARFVHTSSVTAREPQLSDYAHSKWQAEQEAVKFGPNTAIIRPNAIYGPGDTETLQVFQIAQKPLQPVFNMPDGRIAMIHGADSATALLAFCDPDSPTGTYEIADDRLDGYGWAEIVELAVQAVGGTYRPVSIPPGILPIAGWLSESFARFGSTPPIFTRGKVREMRHGDWAVQTGMAPPIEVWRPRYGVKEGFAETVAWYRQQGWL